MNNNQENSLIDMAYQMTEIYLKFRKGVVAESELIGRLKDIWGEFSPKIIEER